MSDLDWALATPDRQPTQSPPSAFRIWMILAIASTAHSSITLNEESTSRQYYEKAMTYFEAAMDFGDIAALEAITRLAQAELHPLKPPQRFPPLTVRAGSYRTGRHFAVVHVEMDRV